MTFCEICGRSLANHTTKEHITCGKEELRRLRAFTVSTGNLPSRVPVDEEKHAGPPPCGPVEGTAP